MSRRQNDAIGKAAFMCLVACVVAAVVGGALVAATEAAIKESIAQRKALACVRAARICVAANEVHK